MKRSHLFVGLAAALLVLFALLSKFEDRSIMRNLDFAVTVKVQDKIDRSAHLRLATFVDNVMEGATFLGSPEFTSVAVLLLTGYALYDRKNRRFRWKALIIPLGFMIIVLVELYGKAAVHHPAPPFFMVKNPTTVFPKFYVNEEFSYPSGHAARAVFVAVSLWWVLQTAVKKKLWLGIALGGYVFLVALSKIYLGHHWLSDVIGGWLLGSGAGILTAGVIL